MKDDKVYIKHILDEANFLIEEAGKLDFESFVQDEVLKRAVARSLEIIGKAAKNVSENFRTKHQEIGWKELAGLRDKLIHHYFGINWERVWDVLINIVPGLKKQAESLLRDNT